MRGFPFIGPPMIAPFWHDVDITRRGIISYREANSTALLERAKDDLMYMYYEFPDLESFQPSSLFVATWTNVAQFGYDSEVYSN